MELETKMDWAHLLYRTYQEKYGGENDVNSKEKEKNYPEAN